MKLRQFVFIATLLAAASIAGSGVRPQGPVDAGGDARPPGPPPDAGQSADEVVDLNGLRNVEFGDTEEDLTRRGMLTSDVDACGPTLAGHGAVSPIFVDNRLVLLWLDDPVRTPQGISVGTPIDEVRARYRSVSPLDAPQRTYRFDGLLARSGDRGYLFLHDGHTVRKIIAGYADWARRLFDEGYGPC
ncbi:hypothetical protein MCAG_02499 [Micromonospora sp. ATCC 39149]|uniref:Uncharacterized protein n=1 Tax=Micromonospora carbonacea TaxID=47853 RepID=A0A7D6CCR0_9ACTN|nr:hypothetical protein [Micromonospora sp. ATCC 39149]EEP72172.1 hypothetical protein MCAG_02499 [Micromonospora sp. ATCC 39149]QLJ98363.1 hypothetical protein HZU44_27295 [Micromonospora carbonacea]